MTTILSENIVKIRKPHQCFACLRKFEIGTTMRKQVNTYDGIITVYNCTTCGILMDSFKDYFFDDCEMIYPEGCVTEVYFDFKVNNPEDLLESMRTQETDIKTN